MSSNKAQPRRPRRRPAAQIREISSLGPPQFIANSSFTQRFRFMASAAQTNKVITTTNLMSLLAVATTTTSATPLLSAFRLKRVELWGPPAQNLDPVTVSVEFVNNQAGGGFGTRRYVKSDTSVGATRVAHVNAKPLKGTPCAAWQNVMLGTSTTNGTSFNLIGPDNMIVDVVMDCVLQNGETPFTAIAGTGLTVGAVYGAYLDGIAATGTLPPVSLLPIL